ncbi:MAG TPA: KpsF/GutQ family sugar-phosphate isomerase [Alphaproteobacteria bacterium]
MRDLDSARRVFRLEAEGIQALMRALDGPLGEALIRAVDLIRAATGRVIVTGMGKSGHVARKLAATLASVGTPAQFVHPAEASHGDLGMIAKNDAVLALSNSGETAELGDLVAYCKRFSIPLIAFTGRAGSALADAADVTLLMPPAAEACPLGLAPTTSTTMMLALGDAIAVALLERNGFTAEHFQVLHPGGKLGRRLLRVSDLMDTGDDIPLASPGTIMSEVILIITAKRHGCCGIADADGRLVGIITDGDLRRHMDGHLLARKAAEVMTNNPQTIRPEAFAAEALGLMNAKKITTLFAVRDGRPVGFLHMHALLRAGVA